MFLLFGDLLTSLSTFISAISLFQLRLFENNVSACTFIVFALPFGIVFSYSCLLLLGLNRIITLKTNNFGSQRKRIEKKKFTIVCSVTVVTLIYHTAISLMTPRVKSIGRCTVYNLYGQHVFVYMCLVVVPVTVLIVCLVVMYLFGSYLVYKRFFGQKITPFVPNESVGRQMCSNVMPLENTPKQMIVDHKPNTSLSKENTKEYREVGHKPSTSFNKDGYLPNECLYDIFIVDEDKQGNNEHQEISSFEFKAFMTDNIKTDNRHCNIIIDLCSDDSNETYCGEKETNQSKNKVSLTHIHPNANAGKHKERTESSKSEGSDRTWEVRVFVTCVVIAFQSVLLTGPIIVAYWVDILSGIQMELETKFLCFFPYFINILSNPVLYIWRVTEVRQELKKMISKLLNCLCK